MNLRVKRVQVGLGAFLVVVPRCSIPSPVSLAGWYDSRTADINVAVESYLFVSSRASGVNIKSVL